MSAPFSPPISRELRTLLCTAILVGIVLPFARRDDPLGWLALLLGFIAVLMMVGVLSHAAIKNILAWIRDKPIEPEDPAVGECFTNHAYSLEWNHDQFRVKSYPGNSIIEVPLSHLFEVVSARAFYIQGELNVETPSKSISLPSSRSVRYKLATLIRYLAYHNVDFRCRLSQLQSQFLREGIWKLLQSLLLLGVLLLPITFFPDFKPQGLFWILPGFVYGFSWYPAMYRFALAISLLSTTRHLKSLTSQSLPP